MAARRWLEAGRKEEEDKSVRGQAAKQRWRKLDQEQLTVQAESPPATGSRTIETQPPCSRAPVSIFGTSLSIAEGWRSDNVRANFCARGGTGYRHKVNKWPVSPFTGRSHKLVIRPESPDKKFVLIVGDSHLRAIVDGVVQMLEEPFSFGVMSTPGAAASVLRTEVLNAVLPRVPDAVCLLAPSNNLTASRTIDKASVDYVNLLRTIRSRWPNFVLIVGDSHLRAIVDGVPDARGTLFLWRDVDPRGCCLCVADRGAERCASSVPDAVCLLRPNNLTASRTIDKASVDYVNLLRTIRSRWPNFVLIVGDSHLRAIVDGCGPDARGTLFLWRDVDPRGCCLCVADRGAERCASRVFVVDFPPCLNCEVSYQDLLRQEYHRGGTGYRHKVNKWPVSPFTGRSHKLVIPAESPDKKVFVVDFPPRLNCEVSRQDLLRQEYQRVSARMGVKYFSAEEYFPHTQLELWSRDGVHLSDDRGMGILVQLLWSAATKTFSSP
ncbi:hypothetical protein N1851_033498 [Merluccius polli]|uniref:SGNH domain-containing protein n=1 Tax=Merluccius polli TaxID=89951 RepID=A0AA47NMT7_MERPO|nr:hypothetical protein N1851_033498 [Merluccius polli]